MNLNTNPKVIKNIPFQMARMSKRQLFAASGIPQDRKCKKQQNQAGRFSICHVTPDQQGAVTGLSPAAAAGHKPTGKTEVTWFYRLSTMVSGV